MARIGRPPKLTPKVVKAVRALVLDGNYAETAALAVGLRRTCFYDAMAKGQADLAAGIESLEATFADEIVQARATAEANMVRELRSGILNGGSERALQWLLERTRRDRFAQTVQVEVREAVQDDLLGRLRARLDEDAFGRVVAALVGEDGEPLPAPEEPRH